MLLSGDYAEVLFLHMNGSIKAYLTLGCLSCVSALLLEEFLNVRVRRSSAFFPANQSLTVCGVVPTLRSTSA